MVKTKETALRKGCDFSFQVFGIDWAKKHASKFDPSKYQLVHLSQKRNADMNRELSLDGNHIIKAQNSGILVRVESITNENGKTTWIALDYEPQRVLPPFLA